MKGLVAVVVAATILLTGGAIGQSTATHSVKIEIVAVSHMCIGNVPPFSFAKSGTEQGSVETVSSYSLFNNDGPVKITAALDGPIPGFTLALEMEAPAGAATAGAVALDVTPRNVITSTGANARNLRMSYTLKASPDAQVAAAGNRTVTFTVTSDAR